VHYPPTPDPADRIIWAQFNPYFLGELRQRYPDRQFFGLSWDGDTPIVESADASIDAFLAAIAAPVPSDAK
jgi:hypothetical protein